MTWLNEYVAPALGKCKAILQDIPKEQRSLLIIVVVITGCHAYRAPYMAYYERDPVSWGMLLLLLASSAILAKSVWKSRASPKRCLVADHQFFLQGLALMEAGRIKSTKKGCLSAVFERDPAEIERAIHDIQRCGTRQ